MIKYKGQVIAAMTSDGKCPVGEVVDETHDTLELRLISALTGYPMDEYRVVRRNLIHGIIRARKMSREEQLEEGWHDFTERTYDLKPLWQAQTSWITMHEEKDAQ
jgi:hypothetical protein